MTKLLGTKDFAQFVIQTKLKMKFTFSSTVRNTQLLETQIQSYVTNFKQTPYSNRVIKLMNSKDYIYIILSYVNLLLINFVSSLNLRDSLLSLQNK